MGKKLKNRKYERTTACIRNSGFSAKSKVSDFNKSQCQTESNCFSIRYFLYTQNVVCNIFSELTPKTSLLFFFFFFSWNYYRKICRDIWKPNRPLSIIFVLKLRFRKNPLWNENLKPNFAWKYTLRDNPNFADKRCVEFF